MMNVSRFLMAVVVFCTAAAAHSADYATQADSAAPRYTFSWPLDGSNLQPRGGTTRGAATILDKKPSAAWQALQAGGLSGLEHDRRAILAMAGTYRVTFDFLEVVPYVTQEKPNPPYQSWGTEKVYVDTNDAQFISLVHILEMRVLQPDGTAGEPMITKHWRQDWRYQPAQIEEYQGRDRWQRRKLSAAEAKGAWSQTVYQVDESPRYASLGRWQHSASFSTWLSGDTWRPLPRREWSVRDDYQVLLGTNRHTIGPNGWVQEENNLKASVSAQRQLDPARPYVAREYGVARYERIRDADFAGADQYYTRTKQFWDQVRDSWANRFAQQGVITLRGPVDKLGLFRPLFARADQIAEQETKSSTAEDGKVIEQALDGMRAK